MLIPRGLVRNFRTLARKCVSGRPRGPAPAVVCEVSDGTLAVWARTDDAVLLHTSPVRGDDDRMVVPMAVFAAVEGSGDAPVEFQVNAKLQDMASWSERAGPRTHTFDAILPGKQHQLSDQPSDWHPVPVEFLSALNECGRTAGPSQTRFALSRVQVKGKAGQVVGTDSKTALIWGGLSFAFSNDVLVPALPVFGACELAGRKSVHVARSPTNLVVRVNAWQVFLPVDTTGRFPDVASVIPRSSPTVAGIDERDAAALLGRLRSLPGGDEECHAITLDFDGGVCVRAKDEKTERVEQVRLERSPSAGPFARVALPRGVLARALTLGCISVRVTPDRPIVFEGRGLTLISMPLDAALVVAPFDAPAETETHHPATLPPEPVVTKIIPARTDVRTHETNGHAPTQRPASQDDPPDPLAEAEALRLALADAAMKAGRLVVALKAQRKEKKALANVWAGLKQLKLGTEGRP